MNRYAFDHDAFRERLRQDGMGYPPDLGEWPAEARSAYIAAAREAGEQIVRESDGLLGAERLGDVLRITALIGTIGMIRDQMAMGGLVLITRRQARTGRTRRRQPFNGSSIPPIGKASRFHRANG